MNTPILSLTTVPKAVWVLALLIFSAYSFPVLFEVGYHGIWLGGLDNPGSRQILLDLVFCALLLCLWLWQDAQRIGRRAWPWIALTLTCGVMGPLLYLITRPAAE